MACPVGVQAMEWAVKGMVFKAFETHVARHMGEDMLDEALDQPGLSNGGAYTSVGVYPHADLLALVSFVSARSGVPVSELVRQFGYELFGLLAGGHRDVISGFSGCIDMLAGIESIIHRNVRKLYSDTELPGFTVLAREGEGYLRLAYVSARPFADLAEGLIEGAFAHYGVSEVATLCRDNSAPDGTSCTFTIRINAGDR